MNELETVWIVDDDKSIRWVMEKALQKAAMTTRSFVNANELLIALEHDVLPDVLITDIRMSSMNGLELLEKIQLTNRRFNKCAILIRHTDAIPSAKRIKSLLTISL